MRIVSLLPGATEIVCLLGLEDCLVGVSHECDYPPSVEALPKVTRSRLAAVDSRQIDQQVRELAETHGSLYELDRGRLEALRPDLIITQSLCDVCAVSEQDVLELAEQLATPPDVVRLNPSTLEEVLACVLEVGRAAGVESRVAEAVAAKLQARVEAVAQPSQTLTQRPRVLLLEWIDPPFSSGHWNPELVRLAGGEEVLGQAGARSRELQWDEILMADPDVMVIACCGFSIDRTLDDLPRLVSNRGFAGLKCIGNGQVYLVDGSQFFNRPGPRLVDSLELLAHTLHPDVHPLPEHLTPAVRMKREPRPPRGAW